MTQTLPCLHPHPGWNAEAPRPISDQDISDQVVSDQPISDTVGKHCILELYGCDQARLDDQAFLRDTITTAAQRAGATLLNLITHRFEPQGVTGLALLAESHISIHTWPESGYAAVDVFTCGDHTMPERACAVLATELAAAHHKLTSFRRETPSALATASREAASREAASREAASREAASSQPVCREPVPEPARSAEPLAA